MPRKTDGQKVDDLTERVVRLEVRMDNLDTRTAGDSAALRVELADLRAEVRRLADRHTASEAKDAALEQRLVAVEKQHDRHWQLWLAAGGAGLAALVALVRSSR